MHVIRKADYALRAMLELATSTAVPLKGEQIAQAQRIPQKFLEHILIDLKRADLVISQRGVGGGYQLAAPPRQITLADIVRAVDGPLVEVHGLRPEAVEYEGSAGLLRDVWIAVRVNLRAVLESVTLADLVTGILPPSVQSLLKESDAWVRH